MPKYRDDNKLSRKCQHDCCFSCKSGSFAGAATYGWCMKYSNEVRYNNVCPSYHENVKIKVNIINIDL